MLPFICLILGVIVYRLCRFRYGSGSRLEPTAKTVARESLPAELLDLDQAMSTELAALGFERGVCQVSPSYARYAFKLYDWHQIVYTSPRTHVLIFLVMKWGRCYVVVGSHRVDGSNPARFHLPNDIAGALQESIEEFEWLAWSSPPARVQDWDAWLIDSLKESLDADLKDGLQVRTFSRQWTGWPWRLAARHMWDEFRYATYGRMEPVPQEDRGFQVALKVMPADEEAKRE